MPSSPLQDDGVFSHEPAHDRCATLRRPSLNGGVNGAGATRSALDAASLIRNSCLDGREPAFDGVRLDREQRTLVAYLAAP
jgi:hypothetical protein